MVPLHETDEGIEYIGAAHEYFYHKLGDWKYMDHVLGVLECTEPEVNQALGKMFRPDGMCVCVCVCLYMCVYAICYKIG
jgi:hypothetical protein